MKNLLIGIVIVLFSYSYCNAFNLQDVVNNPGYDSDTFTSYTSTLEQERFLRRIDDCKEKSTYVIEIIKKKNGISELNEKIQLELFKEYKLCLRLKEARKLMENIENRRKTEEIKECKDSGICK